MGFFNGQVQKFDSGHFPDPGLTSLDEKFKFEHAHGAYVVVFYLNIFKCNNDFINTSLNLKNKLASAVS